MRRREPEVIRTVDLPSGKILEVVSPEAGVPYTRLKPPTPEADRDLCVCEACGSELVEPYMWEAAGAERWRVALFCPDCERTSEGVFSQACVDRFDECLDDATAAMIADLKRLEASRMAEDVERFIGALESGAILPEDF